MQSPNLSWHFEFGVNLQSGGEFHEGPHTHLDFFPAPHSSEKIRFQGQSKVKQKEKLRLVIHLIYKWRLVYYSFMGISITPRLGVKHEILLFQETEVQDFEAHNSFSIITQVRIWKQASTIFVLNILVTFVNVAAILR